MNGGVNGTMDESLEAAVSEPSIDQNNETSGECDISKTSETDVNPDNENSENEPKELDDVKSMEGGDCHTDKACNEISEDTNQKISNHEESENNCDNSNGSNSENLNNAHKEPDIIDKPIENGDPDNKSTKKTTTVETHTIDSDDCSDEDGSIVSANRKTDTVSIDSESDDHDDTSQESNEKNKSNDIIILENDNGPHSVNGDSLDSSPEVHDITSDNDDCVVANEDKSNTSVESQPRRSSRTIKRKSYTEDILNGDDNDHGDEDESEIEEIEMEDPLSGKMGPIMISNARSLVEIASKKMKPNQKEPTMVIIGSNSGKGQSSQGKNFNAQNLYQNIAARGTTVTPVNIKTSTASQNSPPPATPPILPSLTDDMFVVEAPSFIVPYVYEKPSLKPFREFVDKLGKELEEQREKEEKERLKKEAEEKEKREKDRKERKERGEELSASEDEAAKVNATEEKRKKKAEKKERRRRRNEEDDDASWDEEFTSESEDDETLSDNDMELIKDKDDSVEEVKDVSDVIAEKVPGSKPDNYFDCSLGNFFVNIGLNLVQEHVQNDLLKQQNRKLTREKKSGRSTKETQSAIASLMKNLEFSKENNAPYAFALKKCEFCSFKTESALVLKHHLETPHMKNNLYKCNFCEYEIKSPHDILTHMEIMHKVRGKLERAPSYHQCSNCPFEDNGKGKLARHLIACGKKFKPEQNLAPPIEWEPPAKIPKITRARNNTAMTYQNAFSRQMNNFVRTPINIANLVVAKPVGSGFRARGRSPLAAPRANILRTSIAPRPNAPTPILPNSLALNTKSKSTHQPSISITPLPRQPPPAVSVPSAQSKNTFVICEICDGYIKDLEQLRNHMQWIHKVKIHPKMIYNRPPLNCQKCQFRFFTDQGLERHLLGSHGLVTSSMQEAANKGKDAGRCPVCGRVYQWKLLGHVARDHNLTLKPAHLSYKCTVCTATFSMYKQFEAHVYSAHSVVAKRVMDKSKPAPSAKTGSNIKPLKINDEITIIPQPAKSATATRTK